MNVTNMSADKAEVSAWLRPGVALMRRLRMPIKLTTMSVLLVIPLVVVTYFELSNLYGDYTTARLEVSGVDVLERITDVVSDLQKQRKQMLVANMPGASSGANADHVQQLKSHLDALDGVVKDHRDLALEATWTEVKRNIDALVNEPAAGGGGARQANAERLQRYADVIDALRRMAALAGQKSTLVLDPFAITYFLQDVLSEHYIPWLQAVDALQVQGLFWMQAPSEFERHAVALEDLAAQLEQQTRLLSEKFDAVVREGGGEVPQDGTAALGAASELVKITQTLARAQDTSEKTMASFVAAGDKLVQLSDGYQHQSTNVLRDKLQQRAASSLFQGGVLAGMAALGLLLLFYLMVCFALATIKSIDALHAAISEGTRGNLAIHVNVAGSDEIADIGLEFEHMLNVLSTLVADVRSASSMVTHVGAQLVEDGHSLSQRTQTQAVSLEEATSNVGQVSDTVARNSEAAQEVSLMTKSLHSEAGNASQMMAKTVEGMGALQTTSERMREIIGTIDGIAFQTNLLALNAAVEAARAGDQGKGFAVVAAEVRSLARRSQSAAAEVRTLIAESSARVTDTVSEIRTVGGLMTSLVTGISEIAFNVETMAEGSARQSIALSEVVQTVGDLDRVTIENSGLVDRTSHRSARLMQRSRQLENAVTFIKLRQGTADEALALVHKAYDLVKSVGLDQTFSVFHDRNGGFVDRDLYIFVCDRQGVYRIMGADVNKVGTNLRDAVGLNSETVVEDAWYRCEQGGGWVEYNITNPMTGDVRGKSSYVLGLDDDHFIGCGAYRSALTEGESDLSQTHVT